MKIMFAANGDKGTGSYRIPFIGMRSIMEQLDNVEVICLDDKGLPDVIICLGGQGEAVRLRLKYSQTVILLAKPHYEIPYSFFLNNPLKSLKSLIRFLVPRECNVNVKKIQRDILAADFVIADSRRLRLAFKAKNIESIFFRLHENLPKVNKVYIVPPSEGEVLNVCYHGHSDMFNRKFVDFSFVLNSLSQKYEVNFYCITNQKQRDRDVSVPGVNVKYVNYDYDELVRLLPTMHIGFVPLRLVPHNFLPSKFLSLFLFGGFQDNLDIFAEKASANAGRAYMFSHFGVPFVSEPSPEILLDYASISEMEYPANRNEAVSYLMDILSFPEKYKNISRGLIELSSSSLNLEYETKNLIVQLKNEVNKKFDQAV